MKPLQPFRSELPRVAREHRLVVEGDVQNATKALAWSTPQHLAPFPEASPFRGLAVPSEVSVSRQVLAEPSIELSERSWARLADGTPLVPGAQRGKGWLVLFHVTAKHLT